MSLEQIYYISQTVAGTGVLVSIVYLARQIRQAERVQCAQMQQARADRTSHNAIAIAEPHLSRVFQKGMAADADLTPDEFHQWMFMSRAGFLSGEDSFLQHEAGLLDELSYESFVAGMQGFFSTPGIRISWKLQADHFGKEFRGFIASIIERTPVVRGADAFAEWNRLVQMERNAQQQQ